MIHLADLLNNMTPTKAREVAYFLSRYFKGMPSLEPEGKDFFADVFDREPEDDVRDATIGAIKKIETDIGRPAWEFSEQQVDHVLQQITDFESGLENTGLLSTDSEVIDFFKDLPVQPRAVKFNPG